MAIYLGFGCFWFQARSDDMIVSAGVQHRRPEVDEVLLSHPRVAECGVVSLADERRGQVVIAFVVLTDGPPRGPDLAAELQDLVKQKIAPCKYPRPSSSSRRCPAPTLASCSVSSCVNFA
jgi:2-aminobenzoate-CoA ligase